MNLWNKPGIPHTNWTCIDMHDLEEDCGECEMCGKQGIRYLHIMAHDDYPDDLGVGCICAAHMALTSMADATMRKQAEKTAQSRQRSFVARVKKEAPLKKEAAAVPKLWREWRISRKGNTYCKASDWIAIVFPKGDTFRIRLNYPDGRSEVLARPFKTQMDAQLAAEECIAFDMTHS